MTKAVLKKKIFKVIDQVEDEKLLKVLYEMLNWRIQDEDIEISEEDKAILDERMARHESGLDKGYTWEEVKKKIRSKKRIR